MLALVGGALALTLIGGEPVLAQTAPGNEPTITNERGDRGARNARRSRGARQAVPSASPEEIKAAAQAQLIAAGAACQVTEAVQPGINAERQAIYEAACAEGPGYIVIASTPPQSIDCLELAGQAFTARLRDPDADVGQQCGLPANQNGLSVIGGWARQAGVTCTIDEATAFGRSDAGNIVYEVGCAGADGYWLEKIETGWKLQECLEIASVGGTCRFTTPQEQAEGFKPKLAGTDAAACDVTQVRLMGSNANGRFYEAKCAAEGEGFIARLNNERVTQEIYPCATAQRIGGGCTLTPAPAASTDPTPAPTE
jgi:hypothetical protein